jgi:hypothetical protein
MGEKGCEAGAVSLGADGADVNFFYRLAEVQAWGKMRGR